jgi:hypothetical protein
MKSNYLKMLILILESFTILTLFQHCTSAQDTSDISFLEKHGNDNYDIFKNKSLFIRGYDKENPIIFIYDYSQTQKPCGFVKLIISSKTKELKEITAVPQTDNCVLYFNRDEYYKLASIFLGHNINYLAVDQNLNVSVKTNFHEGLPNLIRYSDLKYISNTNNFTKIKDSWYQRTK